MPLAGSSALVDALRKAFDRRRVLEAEVHPARIVGRNVDGTAHLLRLDGECVSRGGSGGYDGEIVTELPSLRDRRGTTGAAGLSVRSTASPLWVERLDPRALPIGSSALAVDIIGSGFVLGMGWAFYLPGTSTVHPDISILAATYVDEQRYTLTLSIAGSAAPLTAGALGYDLDNRPFPRRRKENAYDLVAATGEEFFALWWLSSDLLACRYLDGQHVETLGSVAETEFAGAGLSAVQIIWTDSAAKVGDRSVLWCVDAQTLKVWNGLGETVHQLTLDSGYSLVGPPVYMSGWVWWIERETSGGSGSGWWHRLARCHADLTDGGGTPGYDVVADDFFAYAQARPLVDSLLTEATSDEIFGSYTDTDGVEDIVQRFVRYSTDGLTVTTGTTGLVTMIGLWLPENGTTSLGATVTGPARHELGEEVTPDNLWPPEALPGDMASAAGFAADLAKVCVSGSEDGQPVVAVAYLAGSSARKFSVSDPPEGPGSYIFWPVEP